MPRGGRGCGKRDGTSGTSGVDLSAGNPAIECRSGGTTNDYQIVFMFSSAGTFGGARVTPGTGSTASLAGPASSSPDGTQVTVNLTNVSNAQTIIVTLTGVNDATNIYDVSVQMAVLVGDVNATGGGGGRGVSAVQSHTRHSVNSSNIRLHVNITSYIYGKDA